VGPVAGGRARAAGSVTHSPDSPLFERRTGLGGPTTLVRPGAAPDTTHPVPKSVFGSAGQGDGCGEVEMETRAGNGVLRETPRPP